MTIETPPEKMLERARQAMTRAYSPYSHFSVGVCLKSADGELFSGCNVENASFSLTLCAEAGALSTLLLSGRKTWSEILIISSGSQLCPPCGACRQRLFEFAEKGAVFHLCALNGDYRKVSLSELFPLPFRSLNLGSS